VFVTKKLHLRNEIEVKTVRKHLKMNTSFVSPIIFSLGRYGLILRSSSDFQKASHQHLFSFEKLEC